MILTTHHLVGGTITIHRIGGKKDVRGHRPRTILHESILGIFSIPVLLIWLSYICTPTTEEAMKKD